MADPRPRNDARAEAQRRGGFPEPSITQQQADAYESHVCPHCGGDDTESDVSPQFIGRTILAGMFCVDCEKEWVEVYYLGGIGEDVSNGVAVRTFTEPPYPWQPSDLRASAPRRETPSPESEVAHG